MLDSVCAPPPSLLPSHLYEWTDEVTPDWAFIRGYSFTVQLLMQDWQSLTNSFSEDQRLHTPWDRKWWSTLWQLKQPVGPQWSVWAPTSLCSSSSNTAGTWSSRRAGSDSSLCCCCSAAQLCFSSPSVLIYGSVGTLDPVDERWVPVNFIFKVSPDFLQRFGCVCTLMMWACRLHSQLLC